VQWKDLSTCYDPPMRLLAGLCLAATAAGCCEFSGPRYHGRVSDHFDGEKFHNQIPGKAPGAVAVARWRLDRKRGPWPDFAAAPPAPRPPERVAGLRVTLVNHATVLIQLAGINVLTDPIWGDVAGPVHTLGRRRRRPPGVRIEDLPPIDVVLLSHDHYDHLDVPALQRIVEAHHPRILAGLGMARLLATFDIHGVTDLDWWQWTAVGGVQIWGLPARHGCQRGACDDDARLWLGFLLRTASQGDVYFAGDSGYGPHFQEIEDRFGPPRLALLPISPGTPRELFAPVHLDARDAVIAARVLRAPDNVPIHFGTFAQGDEGDGEAERKLRETLEELPGTPRFDVLHNGESWAAPAAATN
jgi:L-ascorbate metabolism protein UlaG (beta-lactamase superfamily)